MGNDFDPLEAAKAHYEKLLDTKLAKSAKNIWMACDLIEQVSNGKTEIRASNVGKLCQEHFGAPKSQSIRNQKNTLLKLVKLRSDAAIIKNNGVVVDDATEPFSDPSAAALVRVLKEQIRQLEASNNRLRQAFKSLAPLGIEISHTENGGITLTRHDKPFSDDSVQFTEVEKEAVMSFLREKHLDSFGLKFDPKGRIVEGRAILMEKPVVNILHRILGIKVDKLI